MPKVYIRDSNSMTRAMEQVFCKDEKKELQDLLENNLELLAGDQIQPKNPVKWILVKREMPVPDPSTGSNTWSIDFFLVDNNAIPTFVECKRFNNTRARREVIGQMMEYAANSQYYWTKDKLILHANKTASEKGDNLLDLINSISENKYERIDDFFTKVEFNLKESILRLIFFMEEAPNSLKCITDFLNKQMERTEVLVLEAKQYRSNDITIVVPTLFGYSEEARQVKKSTDIFARSQTIKWDERSFIEALSKEPSKRLEYIEDILNLVKDRQGLLNIKFGTGKDGSVLIQNDLGKTILTIHVSGDVYISAPSTISNQLNHEELMNKYLSGFEFKGEYGVGMNTSIRSPIDELNEDKIDNLKKYILEIAENSMNQSD